MSSFKNINNLKEYVLSEKVSAALTDELVKNTGKKDFFTVFLSVCNIKERARVFHGSGNTIEAAWEVAEKAFEAYRLKKSLAPEWVKADIVTSYAEINTVDLNKIVINEQWTNFSRIGISLDPEFKNAFLEAELNGNKMIVYYTEKEYVMGKFEYDSNLIFIDNLNDYLRKNYNKKPIAEIPERITVFNARGFFCGEDAVIHELYGDSTDYRGRSRDYGRRKIDVVDGDTVKEVIVVASEYLAKQIKPDGKFVYGYFPIFDSELTGYNIVRHASSLWSLINLYRMSADESLVPKIDSAINYIQSEIKFKDDNTAYLIERSKNGDEIKLGGSGVAVIMLTEYMDVFNSNKYVDIVRKLANGILELQNPESGGYWHVLGFPGFDRKQEHRIVYYDGEATFALARAYTYTKEQKFLDGAKLAVENFIRKNYIKYRDHWVAYALFEVTKYIEDVRYYEFALQNADKNLKAIYERETSYHTYLEMLMASWRTYKRALAKKIDSDYIKNYDPTYFAQTVYFRARHMLNGYFYPELAMYMKSPGKIAGSFMVRHHNMRVRIDDIQHFIGGYYFYSVLYDEIRACLTEEWIRSLDNKLDKKDKIDSARNKDKADSVQNNAIKSDKKKRNINMLKIKSLGVACIGCGACFSACRKSAVTMGEYDKDGFRVPVINDEKCVLCYRCDRACPIVKSQSRVEKASASESKQKYVIFYGVTGSIERNINKYIDIAGEPNVFADKPEKLGSYKSKLFGKYDVVSIDEALKIYPGADVWVTYRNPNITARLLLKKLPPEKIHFFEADLEFRKGCSYLGHFMSYRKDNISPCCVAGYNPVIKTQGTIPERLELWQETTTKLINDIRNNRPNACDKCPLLVYGFWRSQVKLDVVSFGSNNPGDICNFRCVYCFSESALDRLKNDEGFTTYEIVKQISEMPEYDTEDFNIQLSNGEFCANKHCDDICDILLKTKWKVWVVTNLSIYREKLAALMETGRVTKTLVSLDAGTPETFNAVKKNDCFDKVVANLKKYPVSKARLILKYIFLEGLNDNEADIDGFYNIVKDVGCKKIILSANQKLNYEPLTEKMRELTLRIIKKAKADRVLIDSNSYLNREDAKFIRESYDKA